MLRPKNASRPVTLALLDDRGLPLPRLQAAVRLHWARNSSTASVPSLAMGRALGVGGDSGRRQASLPDPQSGRRSAGGDTQRSWSSPEPGGGSQQEGSLTVEELPSDDELDEALAAAAAKAEAEAKARSKFKLPKGLANFGRPASRQASVEAAAAGELPPLPSPGPLSGRGTPTPDRPPLPPLAQGAGPASESALSSPRGLASPASPTLAAELDALSCDGAPDQAPALAAAMELLDLVGAVDYPYLTEAEPVPAAAALLATEGYLRVYTTGG